MTDYISREDLVQKILYQVESAKIAGNKYPELIHYTGAIAIANIVPTSDVVERKRGNWISMMGHSICNVCGYKASPILTNFCPNCGADMRGDLDV